MTTVTSTPTLSPRPLERSAYPELADRAFLDETLELFRGVRDHDFDILAARCDDDFGIVDLDTDGSPVAIRDRVGWEQWFHDLFARLDAMGAATDTLVLDVRSLAHDTMGFSVVDFRQFLEVAGHTATFDCTTTIVWKRDGERWVEARWHASLLSADIPEALVG